MPLISGCATGFSWLLPAGFCSMLSNAMQTGKGDEESRSRAQNRIFLDGSSPFYYTSAPPTPFRPVPRSKLPADGSVFGFTCGFSFSL